MSLTPADRMGPMGPHPISQKNTENTWYCPICKNGMPRVDASDHLDACIKANPDGMRRVEQEIMKSWLIDKVPTDKVELLYVIAREKMDPLDNDHDSWYFMNRETWIELQSRMLPGDELWRFCSDPDSWSHLAGRLGWAIVRNGDITSLMVTVCN